MYTLVLTQDERKAFDWVGDRYNTGRISDLIDACAPNSEWDTQGDIEYAIPEHIAWEIADLAAQDDNLWPCFASGLRWKMQSFTDAIV